METVFKYTLFVQGGEQYVPLPIGAEVLHVDVQYEQITFWARVDSFAAQEQRRFIVAGTGHELPPIDLKHLGTVQVGGFVWHVFEVKG